MPSALPPTAWAKRSRSAPSRTRSAGTRTVADTSSRRSKFPELKKASASADAFIFSANGVVRFTRLQPSSRYWRERGAPPALGRELPGASFHRRSQSGTGIPAGCCRIRSVVALSYVMKYAGNLGLLVEHRIQKSDRLSRLLIQPRGEPRHQRSDSAGAAEDRRLAIDKDLISRLRIGIAGNIGYTAPHFVIVCRRRNLRFLLVVGKREDIADASAGCASLRLLVPHALNRGLARDAQAGAAARQNKRVRSGKVHVLLAIGYAVGRAVVTGCRTDRDSQRGSGLEGFVVGRE